MKKSGFWFTVFALVFVLGFSYVCTEFIIPFFKGHYTYSATQCLTDDITADMDAYAIADKYSEAGAVTRVAISYSLTEVSWGSGVCIASNGYKTTSLETEYTASKGSYFATNYHVIDKVATSSGYTINVEMEKKDENGDLSYPSYSARLLWYNKDLDVAIIYTEQNFGYVAMRDNWIDYDSTGRHRESVFVMGTPLDTQNRNRITTGGIGSISGLHANTLTTVSGKEVVNNYYEDIIDLTADISSGNSGGGVFDSKGRLIALSTLGITYTDGGVTAFNGATAIYPVMKALDKVIINNETSTNYKIYDLEKLSIKGYDGNEANVIKSYSNYLDGNYYTNVSFNDYGYYVYSSSIRLSRTTIKKVKLTRGENVIDEVEILDRNDLIYILLKANEGDVLTVSFPSGTILGGTVTKEITLS